MSVIYLDIKFLFHCPFISNHCSILILANHAIPANMKQDNLHSVMKNHNTSMRFVTGQQYLTAYYVIFCKASTNNNHSYLYVDPSSHCS